MAIPVLVFTGGEAVDDTEHYREVTDWTQEAIIALLVSLYSGIEENGMIDWLQTKDNQPLHVHDTFSFVGFNMAQIVLDADDGGQVYVVKI